MFKLILCIILAGSCGVLGLMKSGTYSRRIHELNDIRNTFNILKSEISYRKDPLQVIFRRNALNKHTLSARIMNRCCSYMDSYYSFDKCWQTAVSEECSGSCLTSDDIAILLDISNQIGKTDISGQIDMFSLLEERLKFQIDEACYEKNSKGKMYGGLGFSIGIVIAVLVI